MKSKKTFILHPFLLAISPVLFLYSQNISIIDIKQFAWSLLAVLGFATAMELGLRFVIKSLQRRRLVMSCCIVFLFAYSNFVSLLFSLFPLTIPRHSVVFLLIWGFLLAAAIFILFRFTDKSLPYINAILNVFVLCLVSLSIVKIAADIPQQYKIYNYGVKLSDLEPPVVSLNQPESYPNIYVLMFDMHVGDSCLQKYGYDNSVLVNALKSRGFYVARQSHSNYCWTSASIASFLNYDFLNLPPETGATDKSDRYLSRLKNNNRAFAFLKRLGYTTVQCRTDFLFQYDAVNTADIQLTGNHFYQSILPMVLLNNTPFYTLLSMGFSTHLQTYETDTTVSLLRRNILKAVEQTRDMTRFEKPFILFTHFMSPHNPYCFNENGDLPGSPSRFDDFAVNFCPPGMEKELRNYLAEMTFIDKKMIEMVEYILEHSKTPPVIILQSDHGNRYWINSSGRIQQAAPELYSILNAMYLPGCDYDSVLYPSISSVNTFRVIFNQYFGAGYPLLPDRAFYPSKSNDGQEDVTQYIQQEN